MRWFALFLIAIAPGSIAQGIDKVQQREEQLEVAQLRAALQQIQTAAVGLSNAQQAYAAAKQKSDFAKSGLQKMSQLSRQLHELLETRYAEKCGVTAAREANRLAREELDAVVPQVLARLQENAAYRAAVSDANAAKDRLKTLAPEAEASDKVALSQITLKPGELERAAIDGDSQAKAAKERAAHTQKELLAALDKLNETVEKDVEYKKSRSSVASSQSAYNSAKAAAERAEQSAVSAANKLATARSRFAALQRAQAADDMLDWRDQLRRNAKR